MDFIYEPERIIIKNEENKIVGEIDFPVQADGNYVITHTFVDDSLRGQGMAGKLVQAAVDYIENPGKKTGATCSYAQVWAKRHEKEYGHVFTE